MSTKVYGQSDDLIEFEGDLRGEVGFFSRDYESSCLLVFSDGTILAAKYGKETNAGIWEIALVSRGSLFDRIDICTDEDADPHSDVAHFKDGKLIGYAAKTWEPIQ